MGKRFALVIGVAALGAAVALSATAPAGTDGYHTYKGHVKDDRWTAVRAGSVRFSANLQRHRMRDMRFSNVHLTCDQGTVSYSHRMHPRTKRLGRVDGDFTLQFREKIDYGGASKLKILVDGTIFKGHQYREDLRGRASGQIYISGDLGASHTNCDKINGRYHGQSARWVAHREPAHRG